MVLKSGTGQSLDITELIVAVHRLLLNLDHVELGQFLADLATWSLLFRVYRFGVDNCVWSVV